MPVRARALFRLGGTTVVLDLATMVRSEHTTAAIVTAVAANLDDGVHRDLDVIGQLDDTATRALALIPSRPANCRPG
jgi:hypothetical protein